MTRTFDLRVYTLRTKAALNFDAEATYPRHLDGFPQFGIEAHGLWTARADVEPRLFVLVSYAAGAPPGEAVRQYMQSKEFAEDIGSFDVSNVVGVESAIVASPLVNDNCSAAGTLH